MFVFISIRDYGHDLFILAPFIVCSRLENDLFVTTLATSFVNSLIVKLRTDIKIGLSGKRAKKKNELMNLSLQTHMCSLSYI